MANPRNLKPKLRFDAKEDIRNSLQNIIANVLEDVDPVYHSCLNCDNFSEKNETCTLSNPPQRPPARTLSINRKNYIYRCKRTESLDRSKNIY